MLARLLCGITGWLRYPFSAFYRSTHRVLSGTDPWVDRRGLLFHYVVRVCRGGAGDGSTLIEL